MTLDISHPRPDDWNVYLVGPNGESVPLGNFSGDNPVSAFNGISTDGSWTLEVYDTRRKKKGTLNSWSMTIDF